LPHLNDPGEADAPVTRERRRFSITLRGLLIAIAIIAAICAWAVRDWNTRYFELMTFDCGGGREIVIWEENWSDGAPALCYETIVDGKAVSNLHFCYVDWGPSSPDLHLLSAENGNLVGVVDGKPPDCSKVVIMHDFSTGDSWPELHGKTGAEHSEETGRLVDSMKLRLQKANPEVKCLH
jgi:hypothetical protein